MRIGLIAMSGLRACNENLLKVGLTVPGILERGAAIASLPSLALLTLAGMTPTRHEVEYFEVPDLKALTNLPCNFDLVAISSYTAQINEAYELARRYKELGIPVVIGGPHVTCLPYEAIEYCDAVAIGEGELIWNQIIQDCEAEQLQNFYGSRFDEFDLNNAPMPAFELLDSSVYNRVIIQTSRGCPHRCEFCAASVLLTRRYKQKPKTKILNEIDKAKAIWKRPFIELADDNSLVNKAFWKDLLPEIKKRDIRWFAETDISIADDERLLSLMANSGCAQVLIGLESPVAVSLDGIECRSNWKRRVYDHYRQAIRKIQSHGIRVIGCFILGLDGQTTRIFDEVFQFVNELELFDVQITVQTAFPGTPLYERLKSTGRILEEPAWPKCTLFDVNFQPSNMTVAELVNGFQDLASKLYNQELTNWRRNNFRKQYLKVALAEHRNGNYANTLNCNFQSVSQHACNTH